MQRDRLVREARRFEQARDQTTQLVADLVDQETGLRGYVITGDEAFLEPYADGQANARRREAVLREMLADEPALLAQLERIEAATEAWRRAAAEPERRAAAQGRTREAEAIVASGEGRVRFNRIREEAQALRDALQRREAATDATLQRARRRLDVVLYATFFAGLVLLVLTAALTRRWITMPLSRISAAVRAVSYGDLDRVIPAPGPPDVAALGVDAEQMRRRIVDELDSARRAEQALRSQGPVVAALRDELAPSNVALPAGLAVAAALEPVSGVLAGDWYDVVPLSADTVALSLIDVSGHGQGTGLFALQAKNLMLTTMRQRLDPGTALAWLADALGDTGDLFLTTVLVHLSTTTGRCRYASAGHLPPLLAAADGVRRLAPTGPLLGPMSGAWDTAQVTLEPGDVLVLYTDGLTEARDADGEEFGEDRLVEVVVATAALGPKAVVEASLAAVRAFAPGEPNDDTTIVAVSRSD